MDSDRVRANFVAALKVRGIGAGTAARTCGTSRDTFERVVSGATRKVSADWIQAIADRLAPGDRRKFLDEVFPAPMGRRVATVGGARWLADDGTVFDASDGLVAEARRQLGTPGGTSMGDVRAFVARGFGWIGLEPLAGGGVWVTLDRDRATLAAARALVGFLDSEWPSFARVVDGRQPGPDALRLTRDQLRDLALRMVRARTEMPDDWIDAELPSAALVPELRALLDQGYAGSIRTRFGELLDGGQASLFAVDRGEAICMHIGSAFDVPTRRWVGARVLDRTEHIAFAAMVDRHAVHAANDGGVRARDVLVDFGDRWTRYQKLMLPFAIDDKRYVVTTSRVLSEGPSRSGVGRHHLHR